MIEQRLIIPKVWRSELSRLLLFAISCVGAVLLTEKFPGSVISTPVYYGEDTIYVMSLPLYWLAPLVLLLSAIQRMYNVLYVIDSKGLESRVGIISLHQSITRIRFEDIKSIETEQTLFERVLNVGLVEMGTAASGGLEMAFEGISSPKDVQRLIQQERELRVKFAEKADRLVGRTVAAVIGDE